MDYKFKFKPKALQIMNEYSIKEDEAIKVIIEDLKRQNAFTPELDEGDTLMACAKDKERKMLFLLHFKNRVWYVSDYRKQISSMILTIGDKTTLLLNK